MGYAGTLQSRSTVIRPDSLAESCGADPGAHDQVRYLPWLALSPSPLLIPLSGRMIAVVRI